MRPPRWLFCLSIWFALIPGLFAQNWTGILDPTRAIDWSRAGVTGGIPNRTTICKAESTGVSLSTLNADIAACSSAHPQPDPGGIVTLPAGTFTFSNMIVMKPNVTLRGAGSNSTFIVMSGGGSPCGYDGSVCIEGDENAAPSPNNVANWTAGYSQGATTISIASTPNLHVGDFITLDQLNDSDTDTGEIWVCDDAPACATEGGEGLTRTQRSQGQQVTVAQCDGNTTVGHTCSSGTNITISPGLYMPNWNQTNHTNPRSPQAWWNGETYGVGLEDFSIDHTNNNSTFGFVFLNAHDCWVEGVRSIRANRANMFGMVTAHITVRDSYMFGTINSASTSYGFETDASSDWLAQNNIFQQVTGPINWGKQAAGSVGGYNFNINDYYNGTEWMQAGLYHHASGMNYILFEGNVGNGFTADAIHGTQEFMTAFRNTLDGLDKPARSSQTVPIFIYSFNRYFNIVGNVLGTAGYHQYYSQSPSSATDPGNDTTGNQTIFVIGWAGNAGTFCSNCGGAGNVNDDPFLKTSLLRWGNYDTVTAGVRWCGNSSDTGWSTTCGSSSEIPTGLSKYSNAVPTKGDVAAGQGALPPSFYLAGKPSWWGSMPFPAAGPDVTGGNMAGVGGHAYLNPAANCYYNVMVGPSDGTGSVLAFDAAACYGTAPPPPVPPTNLNATVQ